MHNRFARLRRKLDVLTWLVGVNLACTLAVLWLLPA